MNAVMRTMPDDFEALLGPGGVLRVADDTARYSRDWSGDHVGRVRMVLRPRTTSEVAEIVRRCRADRLPVVAQGGHTGLVGGATPSPRGDEVIVSLERMNRVRHIDPDDYSIVVEAGCILEAVHRAAEARDRFFPLQLGAQASCQIGGNIATNAGGLNVLRYGMMRDLVLGLEVVLPDGRVYEGLCPLRKDNTGYDLKQLFIGAEGTLGVVTAATLKLFPRPTQIETAFVGLGSVDDAVALYGAARRDLGDLLSAFELLPRSGLELAFGAMPGLRDPLGAPSPVYILLETATSGLIVPRPVLEALLAREMAEGRIADATIATSSTQAAQFWRIREGLIEAQVRRGRHLRTDISIPISALARFLEDAQGALLEIVPDGLILAYGHVGDGNVHLNVVPPAGLAPEAVPALLDRCEEAIYHTVDRFDGSISAEHGIGLKKRDAFLKRIGPVQLDLMCRLKAMLDPDGLISPGRILA